MSKMTKEQLLSKINNCIEILKSNQCTDRFYVLFIICEYVRYFAALDSEKLIPNKQVTSTYFSFGLDLFNFRNSFAHSESIDVLNELFDKSVTNKRNFIKLFPDELKNKILNTLSIW